MAFFVSIPNARLAVLRCGSVLALAMLGASVGQAASLSLEQSVPALETSTGAASPQRQGVAHGAMAALPGEIVTAVHEHAYVDGLRQDILLKGGVVRGIANSIIVLARTSRRDTLDEAVPLAKPTEAGIRSEIGAQFPHLAMQVAERDSSNAYGPYGLALGRAGGDAHCLYMWQWIDENRLPAEAGVTGPASIRIRLCEAGTTFDAMAAELDHLTIGATVPAAQVAAAEPDGIILAPPAAHAPLKHKPKRQVAHALPRARHDHAHALASQDAPTALPAGADTAPRYMTQASAAAPLAPQPPVASQPVATSKLSGDLPPQAYLGPGAAQKTAPKYY